MTSIIELEEICKKGQKRRKFEVTACDPTTIEKISNFDKRSNKLLEKKFIPYNHNQKKSNFNIIRRLLSKY